jgi:hypothetical protein
MRRGTCATSQTHHSSFAQEQLRIGHRYGTAQGYQQQVSTINLLTGVNKMLYLCNGYWIDTKEPFHQMVVSDGSWDGLEDAKDERIFFYTDGLPVVGEHQDFVIETKEKLA